MVKTRAALKAIFITAATPTQADFADVFDSFAQPSELFPGTWAALAGKPYLKISGAPVVSFKEDVRYGTTSVPITSNITANFTAAIAGTTICVVHASGVTPTVPPEFVLMGTTAYDTAKTNFIWAMYVGEGNRVEYFITQEL